MASLMPEGKQRYTNNSGAPLSGGKVFTYASGTTTPKATYSDQAGVIQNTNPVILNARGEASIFWDGNYKVVVKDAADNTIYTVDKYNAVDALAQLAKPTGAVSIGIVLKDLTNSTVQGFCNLLASAQGALNVGYQFATGVFRTLYDKLSDTVSIWDFADSGAKADGTTDWTAAFLKAKATGRRVRVGLGIYRITGDISAGLPALHLQGENPAFVSHADIADFIPNTYSPNYNDLPTSAISNRYSIILCDGCNLIGTPDTSTAIGCSSNLRSLSNIVLWGANGAKIGVYTEGSDCIISNSCAVLFEMFGFASRGQITSGYRNVSTIDCGWNMPGSGSIGYPNSYVSGCGIITLSNKTPNDYTTIDRANRPTTIFYENIFFQVRAKTSDIKSGFRGLQAHGLVQFTHKNVMGYTGNFYNICTGGEFVGDYIENYSKAGFIAGDLTPFGRVLVNCNLVVGAGYTFTVNAPGKESLIFDSGNPNLPSIITTRGKDGNIYVENKPFSPTMFQSIKVITPGGTDKYIFPKFVTSTSGFSGFVSASLIKTSSYDNYTKGFFVSSTHRAGATGYVPMASIQLAYVTTLLGLFKGDVTISWDGDALIVNVAWGASVVAGTDFDLRIAAFGNSVLSI